MISLNASNHAASLDEVLRNKEDRVMRQRALLAAHSGCLLSMTVNMPGPVKDSDDARIIMQAALHAVAKALAGHAMPEPARQVHLLPTGPEALLVLDAQALTVKKITVGIEEQHPLGRLFDLDVLDPLGAPVSRAAVGAPTRRCLLCAKAAAVCARSRAHALDELLAAIHDQVVRFQA